MSRNADARSQIQSYRKGILERYAYLICPGPLWKTMNASRGEVVVKVTKVTIKAIEERRSYKRMYTNSAQSGNGRKIEQEPSE